MKVTLVHADWCPVCRATKQLWNELKKEYNFDYEEVSLTTPLGLEYVKKFSLHSVPATLIDERIAFIGMPDRDEAIKSIKKS